jgi:hypothetical protein
MASSLSLSSTVSVLPCPNCNQTINTSMQACPFCSFPIDQAAAAASAEVFARINQACSDASYLKIMAGATGAFFLIGFLPFLGFLGTLGFWFLTIATPVMVIRWFVKFGDLESADPDFISARHAAIAVAIIAAAVLLLAAAGVVFTFVAAQARNMQQH